MTIKPQNKRSIKELGTVIAFRREYAAICDDDIKCGLFLCQADYWTTISIKMGRNGWFYKKHDDWYGEIGLSRSELDLIRKKLTSCGLLQEKKKGTPPVMHYRIDQSVLKDMVQALYGECYAEAAKEAGKGAKGDNINLQETDKCIRGKPTNAFAGNQHYNTETTSETTSDINNISPGTDFEAEFNEFWAAYPKRPGNPKRKAFVRYVNARKILKVPKEDILNKVKEYATLCAGKDSQYVKWAENWLKDRCWENDYTLDGGTNRPAPAPTASDADLDKLAAAFPGHIGERSAAKKLLADELSKGATLDALCEAARKYTLYCKGHPYEGHKIPPAMLETWLKFKWREMDGYEFCTVGPDRIRTVRPKKVTV